MTNKEDILDVPFLIYSLDEVNVHSSLAFDNIQFYDIYSILEQTFISKEEADLNSIYFSFSFCSINGLQESSSLDRYFNHPSYSQLPAHQAKLYGRETDKNALDTQSDCWSNDCLRRVGKLIIYFDGHPSK